MNTVCWTRLAGGADQVIARQSCQAAILGFPRKHKQKLQVESISSTTTLLPDSTHQSLLLPLGTEPKFTVFGGGGNGGIQESAAVYSFETSEWSSLQPVVTPWDDATKELLHAEPRYSAASAFVSDGTFLYSFGGFVTKDETVITTNQLVKYCPQTNTMTFLSPPIDTPDTPSPRVGASLIHYPGNDETAPRLLLFGGLVDKLKVSNDVWSFDLITSTWSHITITGSTIPTPRESHAAVYVPAQQNQHSYMIIHGGNTGDVKYKRRRLADMYKLDLETWEWEQLLPKVETCRPNARSFHTAHLIQELDGISRRMVSVGGRGDADDGAYENLSEVWIYSIGSSEWSYTRAQQSQDDGTIEGRSQHASVAVGNRLFLFGGSSSKTAVNTLDMLDVGPPKPCTSVVATPTPDNKLKLTWQDPYHSNHYRIYIRPLNSPEIAHLAVEIHETTRCELDSYQVNLNDDDTDENNDAGDKGDDTESLFLNPGIAYEVWVTAVNIAGESLIWERETPLHSIGRAVVTMLGEPAEAEEGVPHDSDDILPEAIMCWDVVHTLWPNTTTSKAWRDTNSNFCRDQKIEPRMHGPTRIRGKAGSGRASYIFSRELIASYLETIEARFAMQAPENWRRLLADNLDGPATGSVSKRGPGKKGGVAAANVDDDEGDNSNDIRSDEVVNEDAGDGALLSAMIAEDAADDDDDMQSEWEDAAPPGVLYPRSPVKPKLTINLRAPAPPQPSDNAALFPETEKPVATTRSGRAIRVKPDVAREMIKLVKINEKKELQKRKRGSARDSADDDYDVVTPKPAKRGGHRQQQPQQEESPLTPRERDDSTNATINNDVTEEVESPPRKKVRAANAASAAAPESIPQEQAEENDSTEETKETVDESVIPPSEQQAPPIMPNDNDQLADFLMALQQQNPHMSNEEIQTVLSAYAQQAGGLSTAMDYEMQQQESQNINNDERRDSISNDAPPMFSPISDRAPTDSPLSARSPDDEEPAGSSAMEMDVDLPPEASDEEAFASTDIAEQSTGGDLEGGSSSSKPADGGFESVSGVDDEVPESDSLQLQDGGEGLITAEMDVSQTSHVEVPVDDGGEQIVDTSMEVVASSTATYENIEDTTGNEVAAPSATADEKIEDTAHIETAAEDSSINQSEEVTLPTVADEQIEDTTPNEVVTPTTIDEKIEVTSMDNSTELVLPSTITNDVSAPPPATEVTTIDHQEVVTPSIAVEDTTMAESEVVAPSTAAEDTTIDHQEVGALSTVVEDTGMAESEVVAPSKVAEDTTMAESELAAERDAVAPASTVENTTMAEDEAIAAPSDTKPEGIAVDESEQPGSESSIETDKLNDAASTTEVDEGKPTTLDAKPDAEESGVEPTSADGSSPQADQSQTEETATSNNNNINTTSTATESSEIKIDTPVPATSAQTPPITASEVAEQPKKRGRPGRKPKDQTTASKSSPPVAASAPSRRSTRNARTTEREDSPATGDEAPAPPNTTTRRSGRGRKSAARASSLVASDTVDSNSAAGDDNEDDANKADV
ncbi:hypothetical protein SmJEL517_g05477 [Synchytrium microbalum]|uniref:Fibronectin type-III domain-containing protein n=1 Tax=Synchytrium microbalum TaxID=1806994 RepID=A0A507BV42_9FUNG|nr:uncharacterized protein SmJEL517_g05477 [Synchytrium microbalum]TPX31128.1 hypothetical protein SmJEL517_g05477 [Synchytrium microbalum]